MASNTGGDPLLSGAAPIPHRQQHDPFASMDERTRASSKPLIGAILTFDSPLVAQMAAQMFDWVFIDMEHSPLTAIAATQLVHTVTATSKGACLPIVRVPSHGVEWIKWALDSGAAGIIIPMVNNPEEMEAIIQRAIYPPRGQRSFGPLNATFGTGLHPSDLKGYYERAQRRDVAILPIIESAEGLKNAEAILGVDGVSGTFIGPYDLRLSLGLPGGVDGTEAEFTGALEKICAAAAKTGKHVGSMAVGEGVIKKRMENGMKWLAVTIDAQILMGGLLNVKATADAAVEAASK